jgi:hypothetical protein
MLYVCARTVLTARALLSLILGRMRQWAFVVEHLTEVAHIDPAVALGAADEMLGFILRRITDTLADILAARNVTHAPCLAERFALAELLSGAPF